MSRHAAPLLAAVACGAAAALFVGVALLGGEGSAGAASFGDLHTLYYPILRYGASVLRSGALPLWNPYQACGTPFLADPQIGLLYPLYAPYLVLPPAVAHALDVGLHLTLAAWGMWLFGRQLGFRRGAALVAGLAYAYQGSVTNHLAYPSYLVSYAALPLLALLVDRLVIAPTRRAAAALAGVLGLSLLGGYPQFAYFTALALPLLIAARVLTLPRAQRGAAALARRGAWLAVAGGLGVGIALIRLLPGLEFMQQSWRPPGGLSLEAAAAMAIAPRELLAGVLGPGAWPAPAAPLARFHVREATVGALPLLLAVVGAFAWRARPLALAFAVIAIAAAWYATGPAGGLYPALFALPGGDLFRGPDRALILFGFAVAALAGAGLHALQSAAPRIGTAAASDRPLRLAVAALLALALASARWASPASAAVLLAQGALLLLIVWAAARVGGARGAVAGSAAAALLVFADLTGGDLELGVLPLHREAEVARRAAPFAAIRARQGFDRTYTWSSWQPESPLFLFSEVAKAGLAHGLWQCTDYAVSGARHERFLEPLGPAMPFPIGYRRFAVTADNLPRLRLAGLRYYLATDDAPAQLDDAVRAAFRREPLAGGVTLYEDAAALPRAFLVGAVEAAADGAAALRRLDAIDARRVAVIEPAGAPLPVVDPAAIDGRAEIVAYAPERVVIETHSPAPGLLVLTDQFAAGWRARVDGVAAPLYRTDYLFRGVAVPAGARRVELDYAPAALAWGALGSGLSLAALIALAWRRKSHGGTEQRRKRSAAPCCV